MSVYTPEELKKYINNKNATMNKKQSDWFLDAVVNLQVSVTFNTKNKTVEINTDYIDQLVEEALLK